MERGRRERRGEMDYMYSPYNTHTTEKKVEAINGHGDGRAAASRMYVVRSKPPLPDPYRALNLSKSPLPKRASNPRKGLLCGREVQRRKRVSKYKWYAIEGKVKASFKNGFRWFKRRCSRFVHGV